MTGWKHLDFWRIESTCFNYLIKVPPTLTQPRLNFAHFSTIFNLCRPLSTFFNPPSLHCLLSTSCNFRRPWRHLSTAPKPSYCSLSSTFSTFVDFSQLRSTMVTLANSGHFCTNGFFCWLLSTLLHSADSLHPLPPSAPRFITAQLHHFVYFSAATARVQLCQDFEIWFEFVNLVI